ncbi:MULTISPECIES: monovalent cation/H+ antiporter complex subunit F [Candidatus Neomicrothrix]|jgi:multicomponent Na+:H+ antiporter subunit F|uniref:Putative Multisubunit Na+/H+ antiporter, F subunit n=1 Tax=Candidatus Neomicrothrix parvicella RN1 TaxID=1229780 RepID=R4YXN2_9ACTN|nr:MULTISPECIES: monovalent cation/H+ antiporter complex subunit F [Microthrix]NLH64646.1 Na(+)/H(+) antiporter subunit F [Candidatus Microthrix parvicella]MBK6503788.1 Na(+)/H(+) antiporter subunit F [Candidatus Microthrix sp.]MBK7019500.1 Na(+)/H(+) antiporter subunit F [Candidatus Microthrix sp.]MBK7324013.1 Na(+)/H(+) antiporter subunit F [Candidatus Microthrix sp.]MBL0204472.1 Na(+)/H(+) antiporter subunit F [Candidatus Microthrix sp.]
MIYNVALAVLALAAAAFLVRLVRGPRLADRVVALDGVLTTVALTIIANSARTDSTKYLVVAVVVALVAFVGTVIYARFIETTSG